MHQRTSNPERSHHKVQVEPGWTGCFGPGQCVNNRNKYALFSNVICLNHVLDTKPNHTHSSASQFSVDRIDNALHYSIDNIYVGLQMQPPSTGIEHHEHLVI